MNRLWERSRILTSDAIVLIRTILSQQLAPETSKVLSVRTILLEQSNVPYQNQVAIKVLHFEKEVNLMRYHGLLEYGKQRLLSTGVLQQYRFASFLGNDGQVGMISNDQKTATNKVATANNEVSTTSPVSPIDSTRGSTEAADTMSSTPKIALTSIKKNVAKVAFMITASMKNELTKRLQYDTNDIKTMTPLEASLILQNNIIPSDRINKVPVLIQQYEKEQEEIRIKHQQEELQRQQEEILLQQKQEEQDKERIRMEQACQPTEIPSLNVVRSNLTTNGSKRLWFELVQITNTRPNNSNGVEEEDTPSSTTVTSSEIIGLYKTEKEARLGLETHQYFADLNRKEQSTASFTDKRTTRTDTADAPVFEIRESWR